MTAKPSPAGRADAGPADPPPLVQLFAPPDPHAPGFRRLLARAAGPLERLLGVDQINEIYRRCATQAARAAVGGTNDFGGAWPFLDRVLDEMQISWRLPRQDLQRIPRTGPLVVVANHPFGAIDGMVLASLLGAVRRDVKVMANYLLGRIRELRDLLLFVDPFGGPGAAAHNSAPLRQALRWLKDGGALVAFPAGEVAHLSLRERRVVEPAWNDTIARLVRRSGAPVLPVCFHGHNGALFQLAGLMHPRLRTVLLAREMLRRRHTAVEMRVGSVVPPRRLSAVAGDRELCDYLRRRTLLLRHGTPPGPDDPSAESRGGEKAAAAAEPTVPTTPARFVPVDAPSIEAVILPVDPALLAAEVSALPAEAVLVEHDGMKVMQARAPQIRHVLREIGRLREVTFRAAGEGTGKAVDLDTFDYDYVHLFLWNTDKAEVAGAYRLGRTDELLPAKGRLGLYTSTLFNYKAELLERISPALEMGRSFVRAEYQKSYSPLLLLWKGIGHYVVRHPRYRYLFGPVSISNRYQTVSRQLMVHFLKMHHALPGAAGLVRARHPFRPAGTRLWRGLDEVCGWDGATSAGSSAGGDELSELVAELEPDNKGIPVLLRQYLKLGAKFVDFNLDPAFADALDGLIVVDLAATDPRVLDKYLGKEGCRQFLEFHGTRPLNRAAAEPEAVSVAS